MLDFVYCWNNQLHHWHGNLLLLCGSSSQTLTLAEMAMEKENNQV